MTARRASVALLIAVAIITVLLFVRSTRHRDASASAQDMPQAADESKQDAAGRRAASNVPEASPDTEAAPTAQSRIAAPSREAIASDPKTTARQWLAHAQRVLDAKRRGELGDENARLMRLPPDEAIRELQARAAKGDKPAALAALQIAQICQAGELERAQNPQPQKPISENAQHVRAGWLEFGETVRDARLASYAERQSHCVGDDTLQNLAITLIDKFMTANDPDVAVGMAAENPDHAQAIADLRRLVADGTAPSAEFFLGDRLIADSDPALQAEGRAILERLAADDPAVALRLAHCLLNGCDGFHADPKAAIPWLEQAAGAGGEAALYSMTQHLDSTGDAVGAWAWSLFALDLAVEGCFESLVVDERHVIFAAENEARRRSALNAPQQNAGLARYYEISGRWEKEARDRLGCAD